MKTSFGNPKVQKKNYYYFDFFDTTKNVYRIALNKKIFYSVK